MSCKYKLQILDGMVCTKSSRTFLLMQTYSFVGLYKREKKEEKKERKTKKSPFWCNALTRLFTSKLSKKSSVKRFFSPNFSILIWAKGTKLCNCPPRSSRWSGKKSWNVSSVIGSFGDGQQKIQYFWFCRQKLVVCSEIPLSKNSYHMETSQMTGFYMI